MKRYQLLGLGIIGVLTVAAISACEPDPVLPPLPAPCQFICGSPNPPPPPPPPPPPFDCTVEALLPDTVQIGFAVGFYRPRAGDGSASWAAWTANCKGVPLVLVIKGQGGGPNLPGQNPKVALHLLDPQLQPTNPPNLFPQALRGRYLAAISTDRTVWHDAFLYGVFTPIGATTRSASLATNA